jgi:Na+-translocating ferredoxin:NAD+ oxidoreductase RnfD subunit
MSYAAGTHPHLRQPGTAAGIQAMSACAALPAALTACIYSGPAGFIHLLLCAAGVLAAEGFLFFLNRGRRPGHVFRLSQALLLVFLLALWLPPSAGWTALAVSFAARAAAEIFGGLHASPISPALTAVLVTAALAPAGSALHPARPLAALAAAAGGFFLAWRRIRRWEIPLLFLAGFACMGFSFVFREPAVSLAFFAMTDPPSMPMSRPAHRVIALTAGVLCGFHPSAGTAYFAAVLLLAGCASAWLDRPKLFSRAKA